MARINGELLSAPGAAAGKRSIVDDSTYDIAKQIRDKYRILAHINYRWDTQVGITENDFITATSIIEPLGTNYYGILNVRAMGGEKDIKKIFGVKGLWHGGGGNIRNPHTNLTGFEAFRDKILSNPARRSTLESLRRPYWGTKVPQWIYLEYGDDGSQTGNITPPGNALGLTKDPKSIFTRWGKSLRARIRAARI